MLLLNLAIVELFEFLVASDGICGFTIRRSDHTFVVTALENILRFSFQAVKAPQVDSTVHSSGNDAAVVIVPMKAPNFSVVSSKVPNVLARVSVVNLDRVAVHRSEVLATIAEATLLAGLDSEFFVSNQALHEDIYEPQLIGKSDKYIEPTRMKGNRESFLLPTLGDFRALFLVIPHANSTIGPTRSDERLANACIKPSDSLQKQKRIKKGIGLAMIPFFPSVLKNS